MSAHRPNDPVIEHPSTERIMAVIHQIKDGVDQVRAEGLEADYPIIVQIDGYYYSFRGCLEGWDARTIQSLR